MFHDTEIGSRPDENLPDPSGPCFVNFIPSLQSKATPMPIPIFDIQLLCDLDEAAAALGVLATNNPEEVRRRFHLAQRVRLAVQHAERALAYIKRLEVIVTCSNMLPFPEDAELDDSDLFDSPEDSD